MNMPNQKRKHFRKAHHVVVEWNNGKQNIVDIKDLRATGKNRWSKKQIRGECNEKVKMFYENKFYFGTIIVSDPKKIKELQGTYGKSDPLNGSLSYFKNGKEENEIATCAEICIEKDEEEDEMDEETAGPVLEENLDFEVMNTSVSESFEETTVIYEDFEEEYEEKYKPQESYFNISVNEVISQTDSSASDNLPSAEGENLNGNSSLSKNVKISLYEQKFGIKPCSVVLEKCDFQKNTKDRTESTFNISFSNYSSLKASILEIASFHKDLHETNLVSSTKKSKIVHFNDDDELPSSKRIKLNFSSTLAEKCTNYVADQQLVEKNVVAAEDATCIQGLQVPYKSNKSLENNNSLKLADKVTNMINYLPSSNHVVLNENNYTLKDFPDKKSFSFLPILANDDKYVESSASKDNDSASQIFEKDTFTKNVHSHFLSKQKSKISVDSKCTELEVFNPKKGSLKSSLNLHNTMSSLVASINSTKNSGFGFSPQTNCKEKPNNVSLQVKLQSFLTNGKFSFDVKSVVPYGQPPNNFIHQFRNTLYPSNILKSINLCRISSNNTLKLPDITFKSPLIYLFNLVKETKEVSLHTTLLPETRIIEMSTQQNVANASTNLLDVTYNTAILNSKNEESNKRKNSSLEKPIRTNKTIQNMKIATPILQPSHFVGDIPNLNKLKVNLPNMAAVKVVNENRKIVTTRNIQNKTTNLNKELFLSLEKSPATTSKTEVISDPLLRRPISERSTQTTIPLKTESSAQLINSSVITNKLKPTLPCGKQPSLTVTLCPNTSNNIKPTLALKMKPSLSLKRPATKSKAELSLFLPTTVVTASNIMTTSSLETGVSSSPSLTSPATSQTPVMTPLETQPSHSLRRSPIKSRKKKTMSLEWECSPTKLSKINNDKNVENHTPESCELKQDKLLNLNSKLDSLQTNKSSLSSGQEQNGPSLPNEMALNKRSTVINPNETGHITTYLNEHSIPGKCHTWSTVINPRETGHIKTNKNKHSISGKCHTLNQVSNLNTSQIRGSVNNSLNTSSEQKCTSNSKKETQSKLVSKTEMETPFPPDKLETLKHTLETNKPKSIEHSVLNRVVQRKSSLNVKPTSQQCPNIQNPQNQVSKNSLQHVTIKDAKIPVSEEPKYPKSCKLKNKFQNGLNQKCLESAPPFIKEVLKCSNIRDGFINADLIFVLSLLPDMEEMTSSQKYSFQLKVIDLLTSVLDDPMLQIEMQR